MIQELCSVVNVREVAENTYVLTFMSEAISRTVRAGQFINLRVEERTDPLLRRPFSVYRAEGGKVEVVFNVIGKGTALLSRKGPGTVIDVLGPLGVPFSVSTGNFRTGVLIAGGLGVAPLPLTTAALKAEAKSVLTFLGARSGRFLVESHLENLHVATDDGSKGYKGTVVELAADTLARENFSLLKIFACGPTAMLRAVAEFSRKTGISCEVTLEGPMGCGIGICQGCPVELVGGARKYALMCKDGPTFDVKTIKL